MAAPGHVIFANNIIQRCLSLLVWLLSVDYVLCTSCTAGSNGHRLSGSLLWVYVTISIFLGVGLSFHAFNVSRPPCGNKCTKSEMKRVYCCEDVLFSITCNFYSDKIKTPQARFCWTLCPIYIYISAINAFQLYPAHLYINIFFKAMHHYELNILRITTSIINLIHVHVRVHVRVLSIESIVLKSTQKCIDSAVCR